MISSQEGKLFIQIVLVSNSAYGRGVFFFKIEHAKNSDQSSISNVRKFGYNSFRVIQWRTEKKKVCDEL